MQPLFEKPAEKKVARMALKLVASRHEGLASSKDLLTDETMAWTVKEVEAEYKLSSPSQQELPGLDETVGEGETIDIENVVRKTVEALVEHTIDVPKIVLVPTGEVSTGFKDFDLDVSSINYPPVSQEILVQHLGSAFRERLSSDSSTAVETRLEDYLVRGLINKSDISYDDHADLLYKLAGQVVEKLRSYLADEGEIRNVLLYHNRSLIELVYSQMSQHRWEKAEGYEVQVTKGFQTLRGHSFSKVADEAAVDFRQTVVSKKDIRSMVFAGFTKNLYRLQKFHSDPERRFAVILEDDDDVLKWFRPEAGQFRIYYANENLYTPDFIVETRSEKLICEPKADNEMEDPTVLAKARAAVEWCKHATAHALTHGGKPWTYVLIPEETIQANSTLEALKKTYGRT